MDEEKKLSLTKNVMDIDFYLRSITLINLLIKKGLITSEEYEKEYLSVTSGVMEKLKEKKE